MKENMNNYLHLHIAIRKDEIPERIVKFIRLRIGLKDAFLFGILKMLEMELEREEDTKKKEYLQENIRQLKKSLGIL